MCVRSVRFTERTECPAFRGNGSVSPSRESFLSPLNPLDSGRLGKSEMPTNCICWPKRQLRQVTDQGNAGNEADMKNYRRVLPVPACSIRRDAYSVIPPDRGRHANWHGLSRGGRPVNQ